MKLDRLLDVEEKRWKEVHSLPHKSVLRAGILRDFARAIHAERSKFLSEQSASDLPDIDRIENTLDLLLTSPLDSSSFRDLILNSTPSESAAPHSQKEPATSAIPSEKLDRFDRKWERRIAELADHDKWTFWNLDAWIQIFHAEKFHTSLAHGFWPQGLVLFVESVPDAILDASETPIWKGRWTLTLSPDAPTPNEETLRFAAGISLRPDAPRWTRLKA